MTVLEAKQEFLIHYDKISSFAAPGFTDEEISVFLSDAQEKYVLDNYSFKTNKRLEGFEQTEQNRKNLAGVTSKFTCTLSLDQTDKTSDNGFIYDLPEDCWLVTQEWVITDDVCNKQKKVIPYTQDEYFAEITNPFNKPSETEFWRIESTPNNQIFRHEIVTDGNSNILEYHIRYIKVLTNIDISGGIMSELHPMTHKKLVQLAATIALENQQEPRSQTFAQMRERAE